MRVRAIRRFYDGWERRIRIPGEVFETTRERFEYWHSASLVVLYGGDDGCKKKGGKKTNEPPADNGSAADPDSKNEGQPDLDAMTVEELLAFAEEHGVEGVDGDAPREEIVSLIKEAMSWT